MKQNAVTSSTTATPASAILFSYRVRTRTTVGRAAGPRLSPMSAAEPALSRAPGITLVISHPRVEDSVHDIGKEIAQYGDKANKNSDTELHWVVRCGGGGIKTEPNTLDVEDELNDNTGGKDPRQGQADHGWHRHQRVPEEMLSEYAEARCSLGPGRPNVVLGERLDGRGAHIAAEQGAVHEGQGQYGQHQASRVGEHSAQRGPLRPFGRQHPPGDCESRDQQQ